MRVGTWVLCTVVVLVAAGCTSSGGADHLSISKHSTYRTNLRAEFAPLNARIVGVVRAPRPSGDDVRLFRPIVLAAYEKACVDVSSVQSQIRSERSRTYVVVRCGDSPTTRAVRVVYTGATVPDLVGVVPHSLAELSAMLGLGIDSTLRAAPRGVPAGIVFEQRPKAGSVVPFGTTVHLVVAR